jgi:tRNA threonylcarbamoyladenosine biosynthesis protein TsaE
MLRRCGLKMKKYILDSLSAVPGCATTFLSDFPSSRIFAFHGELGAGKTTFIKALCEELGVKDVMSSPSFSLVNEYHDEKNNPVYHFDLYRLKSPQEALDIGMEEYLYSGNYCFIEWPERAEELLPEDTVHVTIENCDGVREISATNGGKG